MGIGVVYISPFKANAYTKCKLFGGGGFEVWRESGKLNILSEAMVEPIKLDPKVDSNTGFKYKEANYAVDWTAARESLIITELG